MENAMSAEQHKHNWQRFSGWGNNAWRCTSAKSKAQLEHLCKDDCDYSHHFEETGCGATVVRWHRLGKYFFCAPGASMLELDKRPSRMIIDDEYLEQAASFHESLKQLAA